VGDRPAAPREVRLTPGELLALQLAVRAAAAARETIRTGGYRPTPEQANKIIRELSREAHAAGVLLIEAVAAGMAPPSDAELDAASDNSAAAKVFEVCGPPARVN
jgi:hypothetical protein